MDKFLLKLFRKKNTAELKVFLYQNLLIIVGTILLAFGTAIFITKLKIVSGGLSGIAIIVQSFFPEVDLIDILIACLTILLWFVGLFTLGKKFIARTTLSSFLYSGLIVLFMRVPFFVELAEGVAGPGDSGSILICAMFYGVFAGAGVALTFLGGGSSGGVDILIYLIARKTNLKESAISLIIDGLIVGLSMLLIKDNFLNSACGIIGAFVCSITIEYVYGGTQSSYQADIISSKWQEISDYAQNVLGKGATIIHAQGGYKGEERIILRVVFEKRRFDRLTKFIAKTDPTAFVTYTMTSAVYGEGFKAHKK